MASWTVHSQDCQADRSRAAGRQGPCRRHSRLPTPETSTGSYDDFDATEADADPHDIDRAREMDRWELYRLMSRRRDSLQPVIPNSPPCELSDSQRPSLPPLKMVLREAISSPPETPVARSTTIQPLPREPAFTAATYKPPSLYPNKKLRTNFTFEPVAPITNPYAFSSPRRQSAAFEGGSFDAGDMGCRNAFETFHRGSQHSSATITSNQAAPDPDKPLTGLPPASVHRRLRHSDGQGSNRFAPDPNSPASYPLRPYDGPDAFGSPYSYGGSRSYRPEPQHHSSFDTGRRGRTPNDYVGREAAYEWNDMSDAHLDSQSSYFVPNHYDYKQGKTRKRSNLPKQSTEIMKTWFDKNILNPYPSEEQKAMFSNVTGISMTQVSNWFINHRRRCPELRDKREKSRGHDYEM